MGRKKNIADGSVVETHHYNDQQKGILVWLFRKKQETGFNLFPWSVPEYLGRRPRAAESAGLSRTLLELQRIGDVELLDVRKRKGDNKRRRTTHVRLSTRGHEVARYLAEGHDITRSWQHREFNVNRYKALNIASSLVKREHLKILAILEKGTADITAYGLPGGAGGEKWTEEQVRVYVADLRSALELFVEEQQQLSESSGELKAVLSDRVQESAETTDREGANSEADSY